MSSLAERPKYTARLIRALGLLAACAAGLATGHAAMSTHPGYASRVRGDIGSLSCRTASCVYVVDRLFGMKEDKVAIYGAASNGDAAPLREIKGGRTRLFFAQDIALDANRNIYVCDSNSVTVYAAGTSGDAAPIQRIRGTRTGIRVISGIAVDASENIYIVNNFYGSLGEVLVFAAGADGNVAPIRAITGYATGLNTPARAAVDAEGNLYITNTDGGSVTVYPPGANGNVAPIAQISGRHTKVTDPIGIAVDGGGNVYVTTPPTNSVEVFAAGANGDVRPSRVIHGSETLLRYPYGIAVDAVGDVYVSNLSRFPKPRSINVYAPKADGNVPPLRLVRGPRTNLDDPLGLAVR